MIILNLDIVSYRYKKIGLAGFLNLWPAAPSHHASICSHGYRLVEIVTIESMKRCFPLGQGPLILLSHAYTWRLQRTGTNETFLCPISQHNFTIFITTKHIPLLQIFTTKLNFQFTGISLNQNRFMTVKGITFTILIRKKLSSINAVSAVSYATRQHVTICKDKSDFVLRALK
jgi:hypothetical protein